MIFPTLCFILGFSLQFFIPTKEKANISFEKELIKVTESFEICQQEKISLARAFENLTNNELKDYIELKKLKEKYLKADEILGQVMLLFLANVKVQANADVKKYFMSPTSEREEIVDDEAEKTSKTQTTVILNPYETKSKLDDSMNESDDNSVNKEFRRQRNTVSLYQKAKPIERMKNLGFLYGKFEGELKRLQGQDRGKTDAIELEINFHETTNGNITGMYFIQLSRDNVPYSTNRGGGDNKQIKLVEGRKNWYFLEVSPTAFIEINRPQNSDKLEGNFYQNNIYVGEVRLYRKD